MNHRLKHEGAHQLAPNHRPLAGAPRAHNGWHEFNHRIATAAEAVVIPLASAKAPPLAQDPTFNQPPSVSFVALSDRIASQTAPGTTVPSPMPDKLLAPYVRNLNFSAVTEAVRALRHDPPGLALTILLMLLAAAFALYLFAGVAA